MTTCSISLMLVPSIRSTTPTPSIRSGAVSLTLVPSIHSATGRDDADTLDQQRTSISLMPTPSIRSGAVSLTLVPAIHTRCPG